MILFTVYETEPDRVCRIGDVLTMPTCQGSLRELLIQCAEIDEIGQRPASHGGRLLGD